MQTMTQPIQWGTVPLILDHPVFEAGYTRGRAYYFDDASDEEEPTEPLTTERLLTLIAVRDTHGHYQVEDGEEMSHFRAGVEEMMGVLVGYLSGPLHPETREEYTTCCSDCTLIEE